LLSKCSFLTQALYRSVTDLSSPWSSSAPCPETLTPHVTGSVVLGEWTSSGDSLCAGVDRRKVRSDRATEQGKLEELDSKLKAELHRRDRRGISGEIWVRSERFAYGLGRRACPVAMFVYKWERGGRELQARGAQ